MYNNNNTNTNNNNNTSPAPAALWRGAAPRSRPSRPCPRLYAQSPY